MIFELQACLYIPLVLNSASPASFPKALREHVEQISSGKHEYEIQMDGTLDGFNTVYYEEKAPAQGDFVAQLITTPYYIKIIPKTSGKITFIRK